MEEKYAKHLTFSQKDLPGTVNIPIDVTLVRLYYIMGESEIKQENVFFHTRIGCCIKSDRKSFSRWSNTIELYTQYIGEVQESTVDSGKSKSEDKIIYEVYCFDNKVDEGYKKIKKYLVKLSNKINKEMIKNSKNLETLDNLIKQQ